MLNAKIKLKKSIEIGVRYLFSLINNDQGLRFENERSSCSGIWVTAEALEFLLTSNNYHQDGQVFNNINLLIKFIVDSQNIDGSWNVLKNRHGNKMPSSISTGHCVYVLKLALCKNYITNENPFEKIYNAIKNGEAWLLNNYHQNNENIFWKTGVKQVGESVTIDTDGQRIEFVFTTFYAMLGFVIPDGYFDGIKELDFNCWIREENEKDLINQVVLKIRNFFNQQATYFYNTYRNKDLDMNIFSQIASTISRICGGLKYLGGKIERETEEGLKKILVSNMDEAYCTSALRVEVDIAQESTATYNNNTPFDIAIALFNLDDDYSNIKPIINKFLTEQNELGFWYLNFTSIPGEIKAWSTVEALMVIERALKYEQNTRIKNKILNFIKKILRKRLTFTIIGLLLTAIIMVIVISINFNNSTNELLLWEVMKNIMGYVLIPLVCGIILDICKK